jgi:hypothetical protein
LLHLAEDYDEAGPRAAAMIEALRAFGYDLPTALADLVDNSITAGASRIWLNFHWDGANSCIILRDDGQGMSEAELVDAMRPGNRSPLENRSPDDLGRFGLGLKTASFSQCRLLTVRSRHAGSTPATRCWDLDYVAQCDDWRLLRAAPNGAEKHLEALDLTDAGTIVLWQRLDRIVGDESAEDAVAQDRFYIALDEVKRHLAMTFHDYLRGRGALQIFVNGHALAGWNPFLSDHAATQSLPQETLFCDDCEVVVKPYVLPHHTWLNGDEWNAAAGPRGWNAGQGFYVYRNRRLLSGGDWLGLNFQQEEHYKLARIRVDLPNNADADWHLDVKKSCARPPAALRKDLHRIAKATRVQASAVYRHRGARLLPAPGAEQLHLWEARKRRGKRFYRVNTEHPLVQTVIKGASNPGAVGALLKMLQETIPVPLIALGNAEDPQGHATPFEGASTHRVQAVMQQTYRALLDAGHSPAQARLRLAQMDAFANFPELLATLDENRNDETDFGDDETGDDL